MIWRVVKIVLVCAVIALILLWLWSGGFGVVTRFVKTIPNPIDILFGTSTANYSVNLPWQRGIPQGPDITGLTQAGNRETGQSPEAQLSDTQNQYADTQAQIQQSRTYGSPSPHTGSVVLSRGNASESPLRDEYVGLFVRGSAAVNLAGWSLQSVLSGARVYLPPATPVFISGSVNALQPVVLEPGDSAYVTTGPSPVGASFRENRCTGYLGQTQYFNPSLANACPASSEVAPLSADNLRQYGSDCMDYARSLPSCTFPTSLPSSLTPGCRAYIANTFSYNGCVNQIRYASSFSLDTWRLYLGSPAELWNNAHDIIRLLDGNGLTVGAITY